MADKDDRLGVNEILHNLLIEGIFLRHALALVMSFLAVDQVMMETKRIVGLDVDFVFGHAAAPIVINASHAMVDDNNHSPMQVVP